MSGLTGLLLACGGGSTGPRLVSLAVFPATANVSAGLTQRFSATGHYSDGSAGRLAVTWSVSDIVLAKVDSAGLVTTFKPGNVEITATTDGIAGASSLLIGPPVPLTLGIVPGNGQGFGFSIDSSAGTVTPLAGSPFPLSNLGGTFSFHPSGDFLFVANSDGQSIDTYSVARPSGALTLAGTILATCINPTPLSFTPDGNFAYTTCAMDPSHKPNPTVESFAVGLDGLLTHLASSPLPFPASSSNM